jgi:hypothetical protein
MLRLLTDEDVHGDIVHGLRRRQPALDLVRAQDVGLRQTYGRSFTYCASRKLALALLPRTVPTGSTSSSRQAEHRWAQTSG